MSAVKQTHRALAVELVSKLGCWGKDMSGQPNALGHIDLDLVAQAIADAETRAVAPLIAVLRSRGLLHLGEQGFFFEVFGKPATVESYSTIQEAAKAACTKLGLLPATKEEPTDGKA